MRTLETIREFKTKHFTIRAQAVEDCDLDLSFDETGETREKLESGEWQAFGVIVTAYLNGSEVAEDSLWGCIYESPESFMDHLGLKAKSRADNRNYGSYFSDMVRNVCTEARKTIADMQAIRVR